jgi:hypothetical protein
MHEALEVYFRDIKANQLFEGEPISKADIAKRCGALVDMSEMEPIEKAKLKGLMIGYVLKWFEGDMNGYDIIDVEKEFVNKDLVDGSTFVGKVDGLVRRKSDGKYFILEHKTASIVDESYVSQKQIDSQTMTYAICLENAMDIEISGAIHDIITKQKIRQKKGESEADFCDRLIADVTDENFDRIIVDFDRETLDDFKYELMNACTDMEECHRFYKCTGQCIGRFGACEYLPLCKIGGLDKTGGIVGDLVSKYELSRAHEEISQSTISEACDE